jgi:membrane associated rhomboid family serine protease
MTATFDVRFHAGRANWPANPFHFQGKGQIAIEPDFVLVRGSSHRSFRFPVRAEHRLRMVDIVNVHTDGEDVHFHVLGVRENLAVGFSTPDAATAQQIVALLPARRTEAFAIAHAERNDFHDRIDYWSPSTPVLWTLLALNIGIYFLMWLVRRNLPGGAMGSMLGWGWNSNYDAMLRSVQLVDWGSNVGRLTLHGQWWRLVTSLFLHGSILHLAFNMIALWQVGQLVERLFGSLRFTALYLIAGVCGSLASVMWNAHVNSVGASGAIFGIVGGLLAFMRRENSGVPPTVVQDLRGSLLPFLVFNLAAGFLYPHTDNAAHIGGLAGGWLAGHLLARSLHVPAERSTA